MRIVRSRAEQRDRRTLDALHQIGTELGHGVSILVNLLNPAVVVLGGYFAALPEWLVEPIRNQVVANVLAPGAGGARIVASRLGFTAATAGGALAALRRVLDDPTVVSGSDEVFGERSEPTSTVPPGQPNVDDAEEAPA
jgi:predicted NBD/HSP70 family sugar kinase